MKNLKIDDFPKLRVTRGYLFSTDGKHSLIDEGKSFDAFVEA
jgi:hypothetical protein